MSQPLRPITWDVTGFLVRGSRVVLAGEFGSFKSFLAMDLGLHVAGGRPWAGRFPVPEPRHTLYVDEEMTEDEFRRRVKRLGLGDPSLPPDLPLRAFSRVGVQLNEHGAGRLLSRLQALHFDPEFIIIDALRRVLDGDENLAADMSRFWQRLEPVARGRTVLILHHLNKPPLDPEHFRDPRYRISGSTDIPAGADQVYSVSRLGTDVVRVHAVKARSRQEARDFSLRLIDDPEDEMSPIRVTWVDKPATPVEGNPIWSTPSGIESGTAET